MADDNTPTQLTPNQVIATFANLLAGQMGNASGSNVGPEVYTNAIQSYIVSGVTRVMAETVKLSLDARAEQKPRTSPGSTIDHRSLTDAEWTLPMDASPIPVPRMKNQWPDGGERPSAQWRPYTGKLYAPDMEDFVNQMAQQYSTLLRNDPAEFTDLVARRLHDADPNWGRKARKGSGTPNIDALAYKRPDGKIEVIDILIDADGDSPRPAWMNWGPRYDADWLAP